MLGQQGKARAPGAHLENVSHRQAIIASFNIINIGGKMIDIREAVQIAFSFMTSLYDRTQLRGLLLEEVKLSEDEKYWHIILGFDRPQTSFSISASQEPERAYKLIIIDSDTAQPASMTIYEP